MALQVFKLFARRSPPSHLRKCQDLGSAGCIAFSPRISLFVTSSDTQSLSNIQHLEEGDTITSFAVGAAYESSKSLPNFFPNLSTAIFLSIPIKLAYT